MFYIQNKVIPFFSINQLKLYFLEPKWYLVVPDGWCCWNIGWLQHQCLGETWSYFQFIMSHLNWAHWLWGFNYYFKWVQTMQGNAAVNNIVSSSIRYPVAILCQGVQQSHWCNVLFIKEVSLKVIWNARKKH